MKRRIRLRRRDGIVQRYHVSRPTSVGTAEKGRIAEPKYDGTRMLLYVNKGDMELLNRRNIVKNETFPELASLATAIKGPAVLDGEVIVPTKKHPFGDFKSLAQRDRVKDDSLIKARAKTLPATYVAFDLLSKGSEDLTKQPWTARHALLQRTVTPSQRLKIAQTSPDIPALKKTVQKAKGEGIILKDPDAPYQQGPTKHWQKLKWTRENDVAILGATPGTGKRGPSFGALKMAVYTSSGFKPVGNVGTGFTEDDLRVVKRKLKSKQPFVARVRYRAIGSQGRYVEPRFVELRTDITPEETHL